MRLPMVVAVVLLASVSARADIVSLFNSGDEGWLGMSADLPSYTIGPMFSVSYNASGGYINFTDPNSSEAFFRAPAAYRGNLLPYRAGVLSWDWSTDYSPNYAGPLLVLKGGGLTLVYETGLQPTGLHVFTSMQVDLRPGAFWKLSTGELATQANFNRALASVNEIWISAEPHYGVEETVSLDNVRLHSKFAVGVPEPAGSELTFLLGAAGFLACIRAKRRLKLASRG